MGMYSNSKINLANLSCAFWLSRCVEEEGWGPLFLTKNFSGSEKCPKSTSKK